jgi:hypothetical protein
MSIHAVFDLPVEVTAALVTGVLALITAVLVQKIKSRSQHKSEKEEPLYRQLWAELTELRRALHNLLDDFSPEFGEVAYDKAAESFNKYKNTLRDNQPAIHNSVYEPARKIESLAREIFANLQSAKVIEDNRSPSVVGSDIEADEKRSNALIRLDGENSTTLAEIDELFERTERGIKNRVGPA